jgi:MFS superfamily sulfate permease-like transporter
MCFDCMLLLSVLTVMFSLVHMLGTYRLTCVNPSFILVVFIFILFMYIIDRHTYMKAFSNYGANVNIVVNTNNDHMK